jgi:hypothetical protein
VERARAKSLVQNRGASHVSFTASIVTQPAAKPQIESRLCVVPEFVTRPHDGAGGNIPQTCDGFLRGRPATAFTDLLQRAETKLGKVRDFLCDPA